MSTFYIARDGKQDGEIDGDLNLHSKKPRYSNTGSYHYWLDGGEDWVISSGAFSEIKNGECYEVEITLKSKVQSP